MSASPLDQLISFNDQLDALLAAGVPMETGLNVRSGDIRAQLQEINAAAARCVSQGAALDESLATAPPLYRSLVSSGLRTGDLQLALEASHRLALSQTQVVQSAAFSLVYPVLILFLVYLGLVIFCLCLVPALLQMYFNAGVAPRRALTILAALRETLPYWIALPPLAFLAAILIGRQAIDRPAATSAARRGWLPGLWRARRDNHAASFAQLLASLLEGGVPFSAALSVAAGAWNDSTPSAFGQVIAAHPGASESISEPHAGDASLGTLPPLLRWSLYESESTLGRPTALRMAADTYRASAQRRLERWRVAMPLALCVVVGGGATLLYGLALFVPIVDLLEALAR